jgi:hypothetical protein
MFTSNRKSCTWYPVCPIKRYTEQGKLDEKWIQQYCFGDWKHCVRYQKEKNGEFHPDNMLPNGSIDESL